MAGRDSKKPQLISNDKLRAAAVKELGLEDVSPQVQDEIIAIVQQSVLGQIHIAVMKALGPEGMVKLGEIEEETQDAFDKKLGEVLPNIGEIVKGAIEEAINNHRTAINKVKERFGAPAATL